MIDIRDAARATLQKVWQCTNDAIPDNNSPIGLWHVEDMLNKIIFEEITGEKAHRWLGWAQAIICVGGGATLEELKSINATGSSDGQ